ncbi:MAG: hypothetical protein R3C14_31775 [Caldilineaceae bacterium]
MQNPTIHFVETMRGHGVLMTSPMTPAQRAALQPQVEDSALIQQLFTTHQRTQQPFAMIWQDLAVTVCTDQTTAADGMQGLITAGRIWVEGLDPAPLTLQRGEFELLPNSCNGERRMRYRLDCQTQDGQRTFHLYGFKRIVKGNILRLPLALWRDTTTLYVTILATTNAPHEDVAGDDVVATGVIHIHLLDFLRQLMTFRSHGVRQPFAHVRNFWRFFQFFAKSLLTVYLL